MPLSSRVRFPAGRGLFGFATSLAGRWDLRRANYPLLAIALMLLLGRLWGNTFNCSDERFAAIARYRYGGVWKAAWAVATGQGRFYHVLVYPLAQVPYLVDGFRFSNACRILSTALVFVAFFLAVRRLFGEVFGFFTTFFLIGLIETRYDYNPFHAQPLWFNTGLMVLFVSVYCFASDSRRSKALAPWLFFLACMFYEVFLFYVVLYPLVWLYQTRPRAEGAIAYARAIVRATRGFIVAAGLYLVCWGAFRHLFPSSYEGTSLSVGSLKAMVGTVLRFSASALALVPHRPAFDFATAALTLVCVIGFAANYAAVWRAAPFTPRAAAIGAAILVPLIFAPNLLYAFTERYREWVRKTPYYVGSFYSAFFAALAVCMVLAGLARLHARMPAVARLVYAVCVASYSIATYSNHVTARAFFEATRSKVMKWKAVDSLLAGNPALIARIETLHTNLLILRPDVYEYWDYYLFSKTGTKTVVEFAAAPVPDGWNLYKDRNGVPVLFYLRGGERVSAMRAADW